MLLYRFMLRWALDVDADCLDSHNGIRKTLLFKMFFKIV